jgi:heme iron utilization protein
MSEAANTKEQALAEDAWQARRLLREARSAVLSTVSQGQPFASLVTPATTAAGEILLLLSNLSEHTRHLRAEPRCALFVSGQPADANPQTAPRVTITGEAEIIGDAALRERFLAVHPYAALYAGFGDFHLWRIRPLAAMFVGGFGRARRLRAADLLPDAELAARVAAEAAALIGASPEWLDIVTNCRGLGAGWRVSGADCDGIDIIFNEQSARLSFAAPVAGGETLLEGVMKLKM